MSSVTPSTQRLPIMMVPHKFEPGAGCASRLLERLQHCAKRCATRTRFHQCDYVINSATGSADTPRRKGSL